MVRAAFENSAYRPKPSPMQLRAFRMFYRVAVRNNSDNAANRMCAFAEAIVKSSDEAFELAKINSPGLIEKFMENFGNEKLTDSLEGEF